VCQIRPTKQIAGQIKGDDTAGTIFERLATTDDPTDYKENVIGAVSLTGDYVVTVDTKGTPLKRGKSALQSFVGTERFKKFYRGIDSAKNLVAIGRDKWRATDGTARIGTVEPQDPRS